MEAQLGRSSTVIEEISGSESCVIDQPAVEGMQPVRKQQKDVLQVLQVQAWVLPRPPSRTYIHTHTATPSQRCCMCCMCEYWLGSPPLLLHTATAYRRLHHDD